MKRSKSPADNGGVNKSGNGTAMRRNGVSSGDCFSKDQSQKKKKTGRKPLQPTPAEREQVRIMSIYMPQNKIASLIRGGINTATLKKHFAKELAFGPEMANAHVVHSLYRRATEDKNVTAAIFWCKARLNWSEKTIQHHTFKKLENMSDAELVELLGGEPDEAELRKAAGLTAPSTATKH